MVSPFQFAESLEASDHKMSVDEWVAFLWKHFPTRYKDHQPPRRRCLAEPGTEAKIQTMTDRCARGESLFWPGHDVETDSIDREGREVRRGRNGQEIPGILHSFGRPA